MSSSRIANKGGLGLAIRRPIAEAVSSSELDRLSHLPTRPPPLAPEIHISDTDSFHSPHSARSCFGSSVSWTWGSSEEDDVTDPTAASSSHAMNLLQIRASIQPAPGAEARSTNVRTTAAFAPASSFEVWHNHQFCRFPAVPAATFGEVRHMLQQHGLPVERSSIVPIYPCEPSVMQCLLVPCQCLVCLTDRSAGHFLHCTHDHQL